MDPLKIILQKYTPTNVYLKTGDTAPPLKIQVLTDAVTPFNLGDSPEILFKMEQVNTTDSPVVISGLGQVVHSGMCVLQYVWQNGDTDTAGDYQAEFKLSTDSGVYSVPSLHYINIKITESL